MTIVYEHKDGRLEIYAQIMENLVHFSDKDVAQAQEMIGVDLHNRQLPEAYVQKMLSLHGASLTKELAAVFQARVNEFNDVIVRRVKVDPARRPEQLVLAIGKKDCFNDHSPMPVSEVGEVDVYFFRVTGANDKFKLERGLAYRGLKAEPYAVAQVNIDDPEFATTHPNGTLWVRNPNSSSYPDWSHLKVTAESVEVSNSWQRWYGEWWIGGILA